MRKILTAAILGLTGFAGVAVAEADDGHRGRDHRRPAHHVRLHRSRPVLRTWVPPRYDTRIVGYDCGRPVTRVVLVTPGYWSLGPACR